MCCFSRPVKSVSATNIFARMGGDGRQFLVYSMAVEAKEPLAMVLPLPVKKGSGETAVRFINLEKYPNFFDAMDSGFPKLMTESAPIPASVGLRSRHESLKVVPVGNFEASFVPTGRDFKRLDERFRLPPDAFFALSDYHSYGFAVFKLKPGTQTVHPMAFEFPTALPARLFFPTVHIHDGKVHATAKYDHVLYCQPAEALRLKLADWQESPSLTGKFMKLEKTEGIVIKEEHCYRRELRTRLPNKDTFVEALT